MNVSPQVSKLQLEKAALNARANEVQALLDTTQRENVELLREVADLKSRLDTSEQAKKEALSEVDKLQESVLNVNKEMESLQRYSKDQINKLTSETKTLEELVKKMEIRGDFSVPAVPPPLASPTSKAGNRK